MVLSHPNWFTSRFHQSLSWTLLAFSYEPCSWDTWLPFHHGREQRVLLAPHEVQLVCSLPIAMPGKPLRCEYKRCSRFISFNVRITFSFLLGMMTRGKGDRKEFLKCYCLLQSRILRWRSVAKRLMDLGLFALSGAEGSAFLMCSFWEINFELCLSLNSAFWFAINHFTRIYS